VGSKIPKTTGIFDDVDHPKNQGVTYWAERIGPLVDHISQVSCCAAFGAIQKNHMLFFEYISRLAACIWIIFLNLKGMKWGYFSDHFLHRYINYRILCNEKARKKKPSRAMATLYTYSSYLSSTAQPQPAKSIPFTILPISSPLSSVSSPAAYAITIMHIT